MSQAKRPYPFDKDAVERELVERLGSQKVSTSYVDRRVYSRDLIVAYTCAQTTGQCDAPLADFVVWPETTADVSEILRIAAARRVPVVPVCGGAQGSGSTLPLFGGIVVDVKSLDKVIDIDTDNHTVTTQTGLIGYELEATLNTVGYTLNHFPQSEHVSGIGGFISARSAGALSTKYGKITEMVLGHGGGAAQRAGHADQGGPQFGRRPELQLSLHGGGGNAGDHHRGDAEDIAPARGAGFRGLLFSDLPDAMNAARLIMRRGIRPAFMRISDELETTYFHKREGSQMILMFDGFEELCELELRPNDEDRPDTQGRRPGRGPRPGMVGDRNGFTIAFPSSTHPLFGIPTPGAPEDLRMHRLGRLRLIIWSRYSAGSRRSSRVCRCFWGRISPTSIPPGG